MTTQPTLNRTIRFFVLPRKVLIVETQSDAVSEDINKVLLIKTTLQQLKLVSQCSKQFFI